MTLINQLLKEKGPTYFSVHPDETVFSAIKKMGEKGIGSLLVMDRVTLLGILTERDYARNVALKGRSSAQTLVREIIPAQFAYVGPDDTVEKSLALMTEKRIRYLPVVKLVADTWLRLNCGMPSVRCKPALLKGSACRRSFSRAPLSPT